MKIKIEQGDFQDLYDLSIQMEKVRGMVDAGMLKKGYLKISWLEDKGEVTIEGEYIR